MALPAILPSCAASGVAAEIDVARVPLSDAAARTASMADRRGW